MRYLLFICSDGVPSAEKAAAMEAHMPGWVRSADERGARLFGHAASRRPEAVGVGSDDDSGMYQRMMRICITKPHRQVGLDQRSMMLLWPAHGRAGAPTSARGSPRWTAWSPRRM